MVPTGKGLVTALRRAVAVTVVALVAGCGGGGTVEPFAPTRMFAFGDESSVIEQGSTNKNGAKYTVNALTDGVIDCTKHPLWTQVVASGFGFVFAQCNPNDVAAPQAHIRAAVGATVADVVAQVDAFLANDAPSNKTLATLMAGANDIVALYGQYPVQTEAALVAEAGVRGKQLAEQANRIARAGTPVVVATIPDMGLTPLAVAGGADAVRVLSALSKAFNSAIHVNLLQDGRVIGIVFGEAEVQNAAKFPAAYGYANVVDAACLASAPLPACTSATLRVADDPATAGTDEGAVAALNHLWAHGHRFGPTLHTRLGNLAHSRARNNPF
jgi:outer membrane lipase/esterase